MLLQFPHIQIPNRHRIFQGIHFSRFKGREWTNIKYPGANHKSH